jgi:hypothetical protein
VLTCGGFREKKAVNQPQEDKMPVDLSFNFPLTLLIKEGKLIFAAANDTEHLDKIKARLAARSPNFLEETGQLIGTVESGTSTQKAKAGLVGNLTDEVGAAVAAMNSCVAGAKDSAKLAFAGQDVKLRTEFQIGINKPNDLASVLSRAIIIRDSSENADNAKALALEGWIASDSVKLRAAIKAVEDAEDVKAKGKINRVRSTGDRNADANTLFEDLLTIQNAASLEYPDSLPENGPIRDQFRLNQFPPTGGAKPPANPTSPPGQSPASAPPTPPHA